MTKIVAMCLVLLVLFVCAGQSAEEAKPRVMEWRQFPVPAGIPATPRPPDSEFLKLLPVINPQPKANSAAKANGFVTWWADYGTHVFSEQPPSKMDLARKPIARTTAGEVEPVVLGLWGIRDTGPVTLAVKNSPFPLNIRLVEFKPRKIPGDYFDDHVEGARIVGLPMYLLEQSTAELKTGANTIFWIDVNVPADAKPGKYTATLALSSTEGAGISLPVAIEVLPYKLPRADIAYGMYFRPFETALYAGRVALRPEYKTPEMVTAYWRDMASHGMTSATVYNIGPAFKEANGEIRVEGHESIKLIQDMMREGLLTKDVPVMYLDTNSIGAGDAETAAAVKVKAKELGLPELVYYGPDEPSVNDQSMATFKGLQPVRKSFRIISAVSDEAAAAYGDYFDCWVINGGRVTPEMQKFAREKKADVWTYDCHHRGAGNATWARYYAGVYTWALGLKGNFLWAYTEFFYRENGVDQPWTPTYCNVLPTDHGLIAAIEWEARREGVEDYRTLRYLESLVAKRPNSKIAKEAHKWLESVRGRTDWYEARNMPPSMYPWDGPELYPMCPNFQPWELAAIRSKAQDYISRNW